MSLTNDPFSLYAIIGYIGAVVSGISLGLIGGGGSILTLPILVFLLGFDVKQATGYSLFIVGLTSLSGTFDYYKRSLISFKSALIFGIPTIISVWLTRSYVIERIPEVIWQTSFFTLKADQAILLLFSFLMISASFSMILGKRSDAENETVMIRLNIPLILIEALVLGFLTGLVGVGGGFLLIPALIYFTGLPMKKAVGTSLLIIASNSLIGFTADIQNHEIDWLFLLGFSSLSILGILIGGRLATKISGQKLKPAFGIFVLLMGIAIFLSKTVFN